VTRPADNKLGFIGLGEQGAPLALNLQGAGLAPMVFDTRSEALEPFAAAGVAIADSVAELGRWATTVLVCVTNDEQLEAVLFGPGRLIECMGAGGLIVVHSTVSPKVVLAANEVAAQRGLALVDAPLTGGGQGAMNKSVVYFVGGDAEAVERCRPVLGGSGQKIIHAGPVGAGIRAKLVHQLVLCGNAVAARDGWILGRRCGLDDEVIVDVIENGAAQSRIAGRWPRIEWSDHAVALFQKDMSLCRSFGEELNLELPTAAFVQEELRSNGLAENQEGFNHERAR